MPSGTHRLQPLQRAETWTLFWVAIGNLFIAKVPSSDWTWRGLLLLGISFPSSNALVRPAALVRSLVSGWK